MPLSWVWPRNLNTNDYMNPFCLYTRFQVYSSINVKQKLLLMKYITFCVRCTWINVSIHVACHNDNANTCLHFPTTDTIQVRVNLCVKETIYEYDYWGIQPRCYGPVTLGRIDLTYKKRMLYINVCFMFCYYPPNAFVLGVFVANTFLWGVNFFCRTGDFATV